MPKDLPQTSRGKDTLISLSQSWLWSAALLKSCFFTSKLSTYYKFYLILKHSKVYTFYKHTFMFTLLAVAIFFFLLFSKGLLTLNYTNVIFNTVWCNCLNLASFLTLSFLSHFCHSVLSWAETVRIFSFFLVLYLLLFFFPY